VVCYARAGRDVLYDDLVELARLCVKQARSTTSKVAADVLMRLAKDYQARAVELRAGELPDIGEWLAPFPLATPQPAVQQQQQPQKDEHGSD
jgi:hypothetical protein